MSLETIEWASGLRFPQGPVWMPDGSVLLVETARGTLSRVSAEGDVDAVADLGGGPSGAAIGPDGALYVCNNGGSTWSEVNGMMVPGDQPDYYLGGCVQRLDLTTGDIDILYDNCNGHRLKSPSDLVFDATGSFWFTDRGKTRPRERDRGGLYYAAADGSSITEVVYPLDAPAGVGLSPDGDTLYVAETVQGRLLQWPLSGPGQIAGYFGPQHRGMVLADPEGGPLFDALAVDAFGNVCVATIGNGGVTTVTPDGVHFHQTFPDPLTTNLCFGGADGTLAFVTLSGTGRLVCRPWTSRGLPLAF
ncbi:MAG: SMP-30/gluconolactonase/LRE family protein [Actinomycetota bacterium]